MIESTRLLLAAHPGQKRLNRLCKCDANHSIIKMLNITHCFNKPQLFKDTFSLLLPEFHKKLLKLRSRVYCSSSFVVTGLKNNPTKKNKIKLLQRSSEYNMVSSAQTENINIRRCKEQRVLNQSVRTPSHNRSHAFTLSINKQ